MLVLLLLLETFSIFSLASPFLISKVHVSVNSAMKLMPSYWIGTPKPLVMFTFFSSPFLPVLAREMQPLGSVTYIGIYIWIDAYICCVCVLSHGMLLTTLCHGSIIIFVLWRGGWGTEKLSHLSKATQLERGRGRIRIQAVWFWSLCS